MNELMNKGGRLSNTLDSYCGIGAGNGRHRCERHPEKISDQIKP